MNPLVARIRRLRSLLRRRGSSREDAEDLVQEAFVRLQIYCNEGNEVHSPDAFLARTVLNLAVDARVNGHDHLRVRENPEDLGILDISPTPDEVFEGEQCLYRVEALLASLSSRTREVFYMHRLHGLSYAQIADHFDISVSAIEKHIASAMAVLGPQMRKEARAPMTDATASQPSSAEPTPAVYAEAAAWMARLHGPNRTTQVEKGLRRWLSADATHAAAFEAMAAGWEVAGRLPQRPFPRVSRWQRMGYRDGFIKAALAVAALATLIVGGSLYLYTARGVSTDIGEQRALTLEDGTRVLLNTDTRALVRYDRKQRKVELKSGEALFEVAKDSQRPFEVVAGTHVVIALGTSFVVRQDGGTTAVTLVDGKVSITNDVASDGAPTQQLSPGQRVLFESGAAKLDQPAIEKITAWRRGLVDFENTPLPDAIDDMNRYSSVKLTVEGAHNPDIRITGVFRAGDASSFAAAVARTYGLDVVDGNNTIILKSR